MQVRGEVNRFITAVTQSSDLLDLQWILYSMWSEGNWNVPDADIKLTLPFLCQQNWAHVALIEVELNI